MQIWRPDRFKVPIVAVETRSKISNLRFAHLSIDEAHLGLATVPAGFRAFQV